jgi:hypothetical protein
MRSTDLTTDGPEYGDLLHVHNGGVTMAFVLGRNLTEDLDRRTIDEMVALTHQLAHAAGIWPTADLTYVRNDLYADAERVNLWRRRICDPNVDMLKPGLPPGLLRLARDSSG